MSKLTDAAEILAALGLPKPQQNERSALTFLSLAFLPARSPWRAAQQKPMRTADIMEFMRTAYGKDYKPNSRETIRRQTLHQFEQARIVDRNPDDPKRPTNSGLTCYQLTTEALAVARAYGAPIRFARAVRAFGDGFGSLTEKYAARRAAASVPLVLPDGTAVALSPGRHNELQVAIVRNFRPRFVPDARVLYVGDTASKHAVCDVRALAQLGIGINQHDKLPDLIFHLPKPDWLLLIEAVTSHGPVSPKRHMEIEAMVHKCPSMRVYVTAFRDFRDFKKYAGDIAWDTEVWIASVPEHMIHFNGPKFLGPPRA